MGDMADFINDMSPEEDYGFERGKTCKHCGLSGLKWANTPKGWRLHDGAKLHTCPSHPGKKKIVNERRNNNHLRHASRNRTR